MKNYEKFKATEDAMNEYTRYSMSCTEIGCNTVGFMEWLKHDVVEKRSLLDAAKHVLSNPSQTNLESLRIAVDNQKSVGKTNFSRYDDADSAVDAFLDQCDNNDCKDCKFRGSQNCVASWLYSED